MVRFWRTIGVVIVISTYFAMSPFAYAGFALLSLVPKRDRLARARLLQWVMSCGFGFMHWVLRVAGILDFHKGCVEGEVPRDPCVLVANHPTLVDISALIATQRPLVFPVKPTLFRSFWARPLLRDAAHIEGAGQDPFSAGRVIDQAVARLREGYRVIIFPEGTRSPPDGLHPFGRAAFEIAIRAQVPIVPIVITCSPRWLSKERSFLDPPETVPRLRMRALAPVDPKDAGSSSRTLRDIVEELITAELARVEGDRAADAARAGVTRRA